MVVFSSTQRREPISVSDMRVRKQFCASDWPARNTMPIPDWPFQNTMSLSVCAVRNKKGSPTVGLSSTCKKGALDRQRLLSTTATLCLLKVGQNSPKKRDHCAKLPVLLRTAPATVVLQQNELQEGLSQKPCNQCLHRCKETDCHARRHDCLQGTKNTGGMVVVGGDDRTTTVYPSPQAHSTHPGPDPVGLSSNPHPTAQAQHLPCKVHRRDQESLYKDQKHNSLQGRS